MATPEELQVQEQLLYAMQELTRAIASSGGSLGSLGTAANNTATQLRNTANTAAETSTKNKRSAEDEWKAKSNLNTAVYQAEAMFKSFASEIMTTKTEFSKFNRGISSAGDAVLSFSKNFGLLGFAVGGLVKGITKLVEAQLEQADAGLKAVDELNKMGAAGSVAVKEFVNLGIEAGLTTDQLQLLPKAIKRAGDGIAALGGPIGEAQKTFIKMTNVSNETREAFQRLGVSQEELINSQADYLTLQALSGKSFVTMSKDVNELRKASLEYTENLINLSAISGKSTQETAETQKKLRSAYEEQVYMLARRAEIERASPEQRAKLETEDKARGKLLDIMATTFGADFGLKLGKVFRTEAYGPGTEGLAAMGPDFVKMIREYKEASSPEKQNDLIVKIANTIQEKGQALAGSLGGKQGALQMLGSELGSKYGLTPELIENLLKQNEERIKGVLNKPVNTATGQTGGSQDEAAHQARNQLTTTTIELNRLWSQLVSNTSLLLNGFNELTKIIIPFTGALVGATAALGALAAKKSLESVASSGGVIDTIGDATSKGKSGSRLDTLKKYGKGIAKGFAGGIVGGLVGFGAGAGANKATEMGYEKTGAGLGVASKALEYGGYGAMAGSILGPVGAAVGGAAGAGAGALMGLYENRNTLFGGSEDNETVNQRAKMESGPSSSTRLQGRSVGAIRADKATSLSELLLAGEGGSQGYNAQNTGTAGVRPTNPYDLVNMSLSEIIDLQRQKKLFAVGAYQMIPDTLSEAVNTLRLDTSQKFDKTLQDRIFKEFLTGTKKRPTLGAFLLGDPSVSVDAAVLDLAKEWAAVGVPFSVQRSQGKGWDARTIQTGQSYYAGSGGNAASISPDKAREFVIKERDDRLSNRVKPPGAAYGGIFSGPLSGYPAELHGNEIVMPYNPNSILAKMLTGPPEKAASMIANQSPNSSGVSTEMIEAMINKFDTMISYLSEGVDIQQKILRQS
jgi:hypothetical protein